MKEKVLSVFIDESGDFGQYNPASPNYYVAMVLHNQEIDSCSYMLWQTYSLCCRQFLRFHEGHIKIYFSMVKWIKGVVNIWWCSCRKIEDNK